MRADEVERAPGGREPDIDLDGGMLLMEPRHHTGKQVSAGNPRRGQRQGSDLSVGSAGERAAGIRKQRFGAKHVIGEHLARRSESRATPAARDQLRTELGLEGGYVLGDRGLAD